MKRELSYSYDYSAYKAFKAIDRHNDGFVDAFNLGNWLRFNGTYASEREVLAIIRRIDTDGDAKLSFAEFSDALLLNTPSFEGTHSLY